jgi:hypothetical protein
MNSATGKMLADTLTYGEARLRAKQFPQHTVRMGVRSVVVVGATREYVRTGTREILGVRRALEEDVPDGHFLAIAVSGLDAAYRVLPVA